MTLKNKKKGPLDKYAIVTEELYKTLCETIQTLLKDSIAANTPITEQEIKAAREFAELRPDTRVARELLEFLDSAEIREALKH